MKLWLEHIQKKRYSVMEGFNHKYSVDQLKKLNKKKINTLELGAGLGTQIEYEDLSFQNYYCTEIRTNIYNALKKNIQL